MIPRMEGVSGRRKGENTKENGKNIQTCSEIRTNDPTI